MWNDDFLSWFKNNKPWYFVSRYFNMIGGSKMIWSLFGSGHGKGIHDGVGVVVKKVLRRKQLNVEGVKFQNVEKVVAFLCDKLSSWPKSSYFGSWRPLKRIFSNVRVEAVDRRSPIFIYDPIKGTMKIH